MVSFTQINEYAHHILPEKFHKNISIYFYNRYNQLVEEILNNQFEERRMTESAKGNMQLIKDVHKRATKLVFKLKK
jgi:CRISPR/Cas system endoribonuclease Cas6 (RAMP superfamily)